MAFLLCYSFFRYVFTGSNNEKLPLEKRDSIISEKKISPSGQGLYSGLFTEKKKKNRGIKNMQKKIEIH
jgi:hypothetical protein